MFVHVSLRRYPVSLHAIKFSCSALVRSQSGTIAVKEDSLKPFSAMPGTKPREYVGHELQNLRLLVNVLKSMETSLNSV